MEGLNVGEGRGGWMGRVFEREGEGVRVEGLNCGERRGGWRG